MSRPEEHEENPGFEPIDLTIILDDFFRILRRKWFWLAAAVLIGAFAMAAFKNHTYVPYYTASSTYVITTSPDDKVQGSYYDDALAQQLAKTYPYILTSDILRDRVAETLGTDYVPGRISVSVMENTNFLTVSVTDTDPERAYRVLRAVIETASPVLESIVGKAYAELMDSTGLPTTVNNPKNLKAEALAGGMAGLAAAVAAVMILAFAHKTIRREEDCVKRINTKCLGSVPRVQKKVRSKKTEQHLNILRKNADPALVEAFRNIRNKIDRKSEKSGARVILVTSTLPGEGKSTIAVNLALSLLQSGKKVALVDCDLRNPSDRAILGAPEGLGLIDFLTGKAKFGDCLISGKELFRRALPLLFVRGGRAVQDGSGHLSTDLMKRLVETLQTQMDYVILDSPPAGLMTDAGILSQYAQGIVFVVKKDFAKVDKILEAMEQVTQGSCEILGCVLNDDN